MDKIINKVKVTTAIKQRMTQIEKITERQLDIFSTLDSPSKGASFSRYRAELRQDLMELEKEKRKILQSILDDNIDPIITVHVDGAIKEITISELLSNPKYALEDNSPIKTDDKKPKKGFLHLVKESPDECESQSNNPSNSTIH